jgi:hypothetical protein
MTPTKITKRNPFMAIGSHFFHDFCCGWFKINSRETSSVWLGGRESSQSGSDVWLQYRQIDYCDRPLYSTQVRLFAEALTTIT